MRWLRSDSGFLTDDSLAVLFRDFLTIELIAGLVDPELLGRVVRPANFTVYEVAEDGTIVQEPPDTQQAGEFFVPFIFAVLLMSAIFSGNGRLATERYGREKEPDERADHHLIVTAFDNGRKSLCAWRDGPDLGEHLGDIGRLDFTIDH